MHGGNQPLDCIAPELLTLKQAAELCGVSERTLWTWARSGAAKSAENPQGDGSLFLAGLLSLDRHRLPPGR